jgi:4-hydroxy-3-polyprenylbenzoate decarboxylase
MSFNDLESFLKELQAKGWLKVISEPVSAELELTEISRRVLSAQGPALLFENVYKVGGEKSPYRVLTNLFGAIDRIALALGVEKENLRELGEMLAFLKHPEPPQGFKEALNMWPLVKKVLAMRPEIVKKAACQSKVFTGDEIDIFRFPIQKCWPKDIAPLITWPLVITKGPTSERIDDYNMGIYRMQPIASNKLIMRWLKHRGGAAHHDRWGKVKKEPLPAAVIIGADPATVLSAVLPLPDNVSEYKFSGVLSGNRLKLVECKTIPLHVPANAEIVLEGYVSFDEYAEEGPYGDHTGYYNEVEKFPVFNITCITTREDPIYHTTYTGKPPDEPSVLGEALNELFVPIIQKQFPEIVDFWLPPEGCSYRVAVVSINKTYPGQAKRIMMGLWSYLRQFVYTKFIIVVDKEINIRDWKEVVWAISTRMDPARDITVIENTPIDYLDFASPESGLGGKLGLDATNKLAPETKREWGEEITMDQDVIDKITKNWSKFGL